MSESMFSYQPDEADVQSISRHHSQNMSIDDEKKYEVVFDGQDDQENINEAMSIGRKWFISLVLSGTSICVTMLSSCWSMASENIINHFGISREVSILGISLYIFGLGFGPLFLSPISEFYGRKLTYIFGLSLCCVFEILTAFSPNIGGLLFGRFCSGFFGSAFLSVAGGTFTDQFKKDEIGVPLAVYSISPFLGPSLGPLISAFINENLYWRWTFYIMLIFSAAMLLLIIAFVPETYVPVLLMRKAKRKRAETGDDRYYAPLEIMQKEQSVFTAALFSAKRPFMLLMKDRMMGVLCFYSGLILAIVYLFFVAFPYIFDKVFNFSKIGQGLSFLGMLVGMIIGGATAPKFQSIYNSRVSKTGKPRAEFRLYPLMVGCFLSPIGLFIFAWTCFSKLHWMGAMVGTAIYGMGTSLIFQGIFGYTADGYRLFSASAMACNSLVRSIMAGVFPLFGLQMYEACGVNWGGSILAFATLAMIPFPFLFYKYGETLRNKSPYAWSMD
ncbi:putative transporter [Wickerhamomyces ciferrii]|uniref:Transporter n=1 Tax=Wickerhamomyces ciferrii (strain ATCC 14091 / BCRC 22168 / CBS 111 / JCM 3599 / NBRC 0793 / NRRL Y-1031 F-60-10) TaxID=1206466 RepID=K0KMB7_WICCF|nr:putative transporter [Wickerhamomyces ciferrii]CCH46405.1 putative transporter [Wickerhamomyces ciferrii]